MNRRNLLAKRIRWISFGVLTAVALGQAPPPATPFVTHQLKPNIYWIEGGGGNSTIIVGTSGVIVVDAKTTKAGGQELLDDIGKITPKPVTTVILTHSDGDHVNGLAAFPTGVNVIAQENNKKEQETALAAGGRGAPPADHLPTQVTTKQKETITLEGEKLELYHWAPAHTSGDLIVYLPSQKLVATGDIISTGNPYPRIHDEKNGSTQGWITTAKGIVSLDADVFIPGHGNIQTKADIQKRISDAEARRAQIKEMVSQGKSLDEIKAALGDNDKLTYKSWTQVCYEELTKK
ncbi:MAG TPA: MBL fold metallo-hydrolase [Edaphobacter sp.]|jgi:cyclase|nr:MBL fold metallo-hydrolase [Edaphobacter sp.]